MRMMWVTTSMMMSARRGMRLVSFGRHVPGDNECVGGDVGIVSLHANRGVLLGGRSWAWLRVEVWRLLFKEPCCQICWLVIPDSEHLSICLDMFEILGLEFGIAFLACHITPPSCRGRRVEALLPIPKCKLSWCQELSSLGSLEIPSEQRFRRVLVPITNRYVVALSKLGLDKLFEKVKHLGFLWCSFISIYIKLVDPTSTETRAIEVACFQEKHWWMDSQTSVFVLHVYHLIPNLARGVRGWKMCNGELMRADWHTWTDMSQILGSQVSVRMVPQQPWMMVE